MKPRPAYEDYSQRFRDDAVADVLEFGKLLHRFAIQPDVFDHTRSIPPPTRDEVLEAEKALLRKLASQGEAVVCRKLIAGQTGTESVDPLHLRVFCLIAYRGLMMPCSPMRSPEDLAEAAGLGDMAASLECRRKIAYLLYKRKLALRDGEYGGPQVSLNFGLRSYFSGADVVGMTSITEEELRKLWGWPPKRRSEQPPEQPPEEPEPEPRPEGTKSVQILGTKEIYGRLCLHVIGQERLKRALAVAGRTILLRMRQAERGARDDELVAKPNLCVVGPSGSGKTLATLALARIIGIPHGAIDASSVTSTGYVGDDMSGVLFLVRRMAERMQRDPEAGSLILVDEADKMSSAFGSSRATTTGCQAELLRLLDGLPVSYSPKGLNRWGPHASLMDTRHALIVCSGAWSWLADELQGRKATMGFAGGDPEGIEDDEGLLRELLVAKGGLLPELTNRFTAVVRTEPPSEDDLVKILESPLGPFAEYRKLFRVSRRSLTLDPLAARAIARWSIDRKLNGRGPRAALDRLLRDFLFEGRPLKVKITKGMVKKALS